MDHVVGIARMHHACGRCLMETHSREIRANGGRDKYLARSSFLLDGMYDDRLLQNTVILERLIARVKRVEALRRHSAEKLFPKWVEVAPVAVAPRRYCDHLPASAEETCRKSEEGSVYVACLNADRAEEQSRSRSAVDLKIWRVEYDAVVVLRLRRKQ